MLKLAINETVEAKKAKKDAEDAGLHKLRKSFKIKVYVSLERLLR